jgi:hypothetical protein
MPTTVKDTLAKLKALGDEKVRARYIKAGARDNRMFLEREILCRID